MRVCIFSRQYRARAARLGTLLGSLAMSLEPEYFSGIQDCGTVPNASKLLIMDSEMNVSLIC